MLPYLNRFNVKRIFVLPTILILMLWQSACANLSAIQKFTGIAAQASEKFGVLAGDIAGSCLRQHYYDKQRAQFGELRRRETDPSKLVTVADLQFKGSSLASQCIRHGEGEKRLVEANKVLVGYLQAMAELAADDLTSYDKSIDGLGEAFTNGNIFNEPEVTAVKGLTKLIIKIATEGYRQKKLKSVIGDYNDEINLLTAGLKRIVTDDYVRLLNLERDSLRRYYQGGIDDYLRVMRANPIGQEMDSLPMAQIKATWDQEEAALQKKLQAAEAYGKVLDNIAKGHQDLYDKRNTLSDKQVLGLALQYGKTIYSVVQDFQKAF